MRLLRLTALAAASSPAAAVSAPSVARLPPDKPRAGLSLVNPPAQPAPSPRPRSPLALWHLLSLDAPTVAALWVWFVARCCGLALPWTSAAAMFAAVWMLYAADRLLDARPLGHAQRASGGYAELEERHRFHYRHRHAFLAGIGGASIALAVLLPRLDPAALRLYAILASLLFAYFFLIHVAPLSRNAPRLPKELAVGLFFPAAVFIPTVARAPFLRVALAPAALCFAAVCTLNCLYLYAWEHPGRRQQAHWTTRFATRHLRALSCVAAAGSAAVAIETGSAAAASLHGLASLHGSLWPASLFLLPLATGLSAALLLLLDAARERVSPVHLRAAADGALLTPVLLLPLLLHPLLLRSLWLRASLSHSSLRLLMQPLGR